jgi:uncharacterized membrane protein
MLRFCRFLTAFLASLLLTILLSSAPVIAQDTEDSQLFLSGFNAYQQKDFPAAITRLGEVLQKHPDTSLRDMTLFWLARSHYKAGHRQDAARYLAQFTREYPDNPLKDTVEEDLLALSTQYEKTHGGTTGQVALANPEADKQKIAAAETERQTQQKLAQETAEKTRALKAKAEADRITKEKADAERLAAAKREEEKRLAAQEAERVARAKAEADRLAAAKAENQRLAQQKAAAEAAEKARIQKARAESERLAALKLEEQKKLAASDAERRALERAEAARIAAQAAEEQRLAQQKAAQEAAEKARILKAKAESDRIAREKADADRLAAAKREEERRLAAQQQNRLAQEKAAAEKIAADRRAAETTATTLAAKQQQELAAAQTAALEQAAVERARQERAGMKEKAIVEYKRILDRFPGSPAARTAAARLKDLGVAVAIPVASSTAGAVTADSTGTAQVLTLEVAQYAAFEFDLQPPASPVEVARKTSIPFEIQNRGNGYDSFYLASSFPAEFGARFASAAAPDQVINQTPLLAAGEKFRGVLQLHVPAAAIDGLRMSHPVKAASQFMGDASQSRVVSLVAAAPLLRALVKTEKLQLLPGEQLQYRVAVFNVGSTPAEDVTLRLNYPAQYLPVSATAKGFRQEMDAALVLDGIALKPGESRDFTVSFQLKPEALAKEELMVRADLINNPLQVRGSYLSNATFVLPVSDLVVKLSTDRVKVVPGQTVSIPARIINKGNQRERISLVATSAPFHKVVIYHDLNRDGLRQPGEPEVTGIGPLGPKEEAAVLLEVVTPRNALDGAVEKITLTAAPESTQGRMVTAEAQIGYSRPMLQLTMKGREGRMVPGELMTVELDVLNRGSNLARLVDLEIRWPEQAELVAADHPASKSRPGVSSWHFNELGAGEKRTIKASFRIKSGTVVGTGVQLKSLLTYQDLAGNRY